MPETRYVSFDLEIAKILPGDFSDWKRHRPLGITCAATKLGDEEPLVWYSKNENGQASSRMNEIDLVTLVDYLEQAVAGGYQIVTWNGLGFDFNILAEESGEWERCRELAANHTDMMFDFFCRTGYPIALDKAAKAMGLRGKLEGVTGDQAPILWQQGKYETVLAYVAQDAVTTLEVARLAEARGHISWITQRGQLKDIPLRGGWLPCNKAVSLPQPDVSWMSRPVSRQEYYGWVTEK
ncbi:hypothetical protein hrd7_09520 [Leptolinea sp. HRD-7]|nr:hypothetical protein hrd7_09520 [Leptolinea sp. HRD-7]